MRQIHMKYVLLCPNFIIVSRLQVLIKTPTDLATVPQLLKSSVE